MQTPDKIVYTGHAFATGGREGQAESNDGRLRVKLSTPKELGGAGGDGTNPEQMFAATYAACFLGALKHVAATEKSTVPADTKVTGAVSIGPISHGFIISVKLDISLPGVEAARAQTLVDAAHQVCPFSNATRGNIAVDLALV